MNGYLLRVSQEAARIICTSLPSCMHGNYFYTLYAGINKEYVIRKDHGLCLLAFIR